MQFRQSKIARILWAATLVSVFSYGARAQTPNEPARLTQPINNASRVTLQGSVHPLARAEYDRGVVADSLPMKRMLLVLRSSGEREKALEEFLAEQQDKSSANFHKWLTPQEFGERFGPADSDTRTITDWLSTQGFEIGGVSAGRRTIEFSGTAGQVRGAFRSEIHKYMVSGEEHWANASQVQIPVAISSVVAGINSLNNFPLNSQYHLAGTFTEDRTTGEVKSVAPSFTFSGCDSSPCHALGPYDFATIYNVLPLWNNNIDGSGQTIAIAGDSNINLQDVTSFRNYFGLPGNNTTVIVDGVDPGLQHDETEADLDVEWSGAVAKNATIDLVIASSASTNGVLLASQYIVDHNLAPVMSVSFGLCEQEIGAAGNKLIDQLWQQAAAEGITVVVATGDQGSAACDVDATDAMNGLAVSGLASTPYNVAVGGTDFTDILNASQYWNSTNNSTTLASAKSYIPEAPWNDSCANPLAADYGFGSNAESNCNEELALTDGFLTVEGGGGGASSCIISSGVVAQDCTGGYPKPSWQTGLGVPTDGVRDVPDVAFFAGAGFASSFYVLCEADKVPAGVSSCNASTPVSHFLGVGGTSASAPAFAAMIAMVDELSGGRQGNASPALYSMAAQSGASCSSNGTPASTCIFYDVNTGTNAMPCLKGGPNCVTSTSSDTYGILSGYGATANYDLATGLGSANAANLVTNWSGASLTGNGGTSSTGTFTLLSSSLTIAIPAAGQTASTTVTVTEQNGFTGFVNLACQISPTPTSAAPTCTFNPQTVLLGAGEPSATSTLTIGSTAPQSSSQGVGFTFASRDGAAGTVCLSLAFAAFLLFARKIPLGATAFGCAAIILASAIAGCGGGSSTTSNQGSSATPAGSYVVTITGTGGDKKVTVNMFASVP